ncbi:hypothetical protein KPH14_003383 [Odynerus spinipes]|uniref:Uncharacterized protein n=1 Tax=Odynerus spinipes TaxID=1348599 RepID=A0AAD9RCM8_9HYME|nr:hypothetical protein KPH14_003383 [Odynerus spinipes]
MASQATKKELLEESLHHHHPEGSEEEVDKEWEEFTRLMAKLKENRRTRPHRPSQAFYPCPPPNPEEEQQEFDPFDYINTIVRLRFYFFTRESQHERSLKEQGICCLRTRKNGSESLPFPFIEKPRKTRSLRKREIRKENRFFLL